MAGVRCTVCDHPERQAIDAACSLRSERSIAKQWGLGNTAVHRHKVGHLGPAVARVAARREELGAEALVSRLVGYLEEAEHGIQLAKSTKDLPGLARCIKEARETAVYIGKTVGLWTDKPSTYIDNRTQIASLGALSIDELRSLAALNAPKKPAPVPAIEGEFVETVEGESC